MFCEISKVSINYKNFNILKDISIKISIGETVAIIGKNGSGKTTLLRCINCLLKPSFGYFNHKYQYPFPMLFQKPAKFNNSVYYNFEILSKIKKAKPLTKWYHSFDLDKLKNKNIHEVSAGQQQKIFLSRIMSVNSDVIFMDEPNQNLDIDSDKKFINLIIEEKNKEKTIIFATHDTEIVKKIADKIIHLDNGKVSYVSNNKK